MAYGICSFYYSHRVAVHPDARLQDGRSYKRLADARNYRVARSLRCFAARHDCPRTCGGQCYRPDGMGGGGRHLEGGVPNSHHHPNGYLQL